MTDKEYREQKKRVQKYLDKWITPLGLRWWKIDVVWDRATHCDSDPPGGSEHCAAHVKCRWEYLEATVTFHLLQLIEQKDDDLEKVIVHELCHVLVNEMRAPIAPNDETHAEWMKHEERVVSTLACAFIWTYEEAVKANKCKLQHVRTVLMPKGKTSLPKSTIKKTVKDVIAESRK